MYNHAGCKVVIIYFFFLFSLISDLSIIDWVMMSCHAGERTDCGVMKVLLFVLKFFLLPPFFKIISSQIITVAKHE